MLFLLNCLNVLFVIVDPVSGTEILKDSKHYNAPSVTVWQQAFMWQGHLKRFPGWLPKGLLLRILHLIISHACSPLRHRAWQLLFVW